MKDAIVWTCQNSLLPLSPESHHYHHHRRHRRHRHYCHLLSEKKFENATLFFLAYIVRIGILELFGSCDLDLDPMTFIYELDPYCLEIYWMCENEPPTSRLSKVIV